MKAKIIAILVTTLLITTTIPALGTIVNNNLTIRETSDDYNNLIQQIGNSYNQRNWSEQDKLLASDGAVDNLFGWYVSLDGDYALIGAAYDDDNGIDSGSAYVFKRNGTIWTEQQKLTASDVAPDDNFGYSVSIDGEYALIGARRDDDNGYNSGSAYVFKRSGITWTEQQKLTASDGQEWDQFGWSVSIDGEYALIGAHWEDDNGWDSGSAYVFKRSGTTWTQQQKLTASDGATSDWFGYSVSIDGDYTLIGAVCDDDNGSQSGSAYVFKRNDTTWTQQQKLTASDGAAVDQFGWSVSIDGDTALIGAWYDDDNGVDSGSAYIFTRSGTTWTQQAKFLPSDGAANEEFGNSVSIDGDTALIGAHNNDDNGFNSGSAYVFKRNDTIWTEQQKLTASDGEEWDQFGRSVSIDGEYALIGAPRDDNNGAFSGSAYVFKRNHPPVSPIIDGPISGIPSEEYFYKFVTNDPDADDIYLWVEWGDNNTTGWIGPFNSGEEEILGHTWKSRGTYTLKAKAKDIYGAESEWAEFTVTMPRNKVVNRPLLNFLQSHPNLFPLLQKLLQQQYFGL